MATDTLESLHDTLDPDFSPACFSGPWWRPDLVVLVSYRTRASSNRAVKIPGSAACMQKL